MSDKSGSGDTRRPAPHVCCDVKNCAYHGGDDVCAADKIRVGPVHAVSTTDTVCVTFKPGHTARQ